jgi:hypothetical protein
LQAQGKAVLIAGNLLAPLVAVALLLCAIRFRRNRSTIAVLTAAALLLLLLFFEMHPRNGANPEPVVPLTLVGVAMLGDHGLILARLGTWRPVFLEPSGHGRRVCAN